MTRNPTLPETNIAPENGWLEDVFPFGKAYFQVLCLVSRSVTLNCFGIFWKGFLYKQSPQKGNALGNPQSQPPARSSNILPVASGKAEK